MNNFIVRTITGVLFVAVIVTCFLRPEAMMLLFAIVTGLSLWEFTGLVNEREGVSINRFICTVAGVYFFFCVAGFCSNITGSAVFIPYLLTIVYLFVSGLFTKNEDPIHDWAYSMMSQMYVALPFACINVLAFRALPTGQLQYNMLMPLSVFIFLSLSDTGAYPSGSLFGKHKLFPRVSPGKSWEGSIGGAILVVIIAALLAYIDQSCILENYAAETGLSTMEWIGLGLVVVVFGTLGDLVESLFKRTLGIKDSGNILPGHGGMLDRFDSALLAIPAAVLYFLYLA